MGSALPAQYLLDRVCVWMHTLIGVRVARLGHDYTSLWNGCGALQALPTSSG
jgi:hypothetical protein